MADNGKQGKWSHRAKFSQNHWNFDGSETLSNIWKSDFIAIQRLASRRFRAPRNKVCRFAQWKRNDKASLNARVMAKNLTSKSQGAASESSKSVRSCQNLTTIFHYWWNKYTEKNYLYDNLDIINKLSSFPVNRFINKIRKAVIQRISDDHRRCQIQDAIFTSLNCRTRVVCRTTIAVRASFVERPSFNLSRSWTRK